MQHDPSGGPRGVPERGVTGSAPVGQSGVARGPSNGAILVMLGGAMVVIGVFLPWVTASAGANSVSESGLKIGTYGTLILGGFAIVRGAARLFSSSVPPILRSSPMITGALIAGLLALRWNDLQDALNAARSLSPTVSASLGIGVWLDAAGAAAIIIGGYLLYQAQRVGR